MRNTRQSLPGLIALVLASCAAPKAIVVNEAPSPQVPAQQAVADGMPAPAAKPDDGIRLPDMLGLPGEGEFRKSASPPSDTTGGSGAVIARPPVETKAEP
jgi:hypothetical protein